MVGVDLPVAVFIVVGALMVALSVGVSWKYKWLRRQYYARRGERWRAQLDNDDQLVCEDCEDVDDGEGGTPMIVNKPVTSPDDPVDFENGETQVLCQPHLKQRVDGTTASDG